MLKTPTHCVEVMSLKGVSDGRLIDEGAFIV